MGQGVKNKEQRTKNKEQGAEGKDSVLADCYPNGIRAQLTKKGKDEEQGARREDTVLADCGPNIISFLTDDHCVWGVMNIHDRGEGKEGSVVNKEQGTRDKEQVAKMETQSSRTVAQIRFGRK